MREGLVGWITLLVLIALILIDLGARIAALVVIPRNRRPQTAMAWLLAISLLPYIGILIFLLFGSHRLPRRRRQKQREINQYIVEQTEGIEKVTERDPWPPWLGPIVELNRTLGAMPLVGGNRAELFDDNARSLAAMTADIRAAKRLIHCEFYILSLDSTTEPFFQALEDAVARGVKVRVLLDHLGNVKYPGFGRTKRRLTEMGADWHLMLPVQPLKGHWRRPDLRNHRKLLVIDGEIGWTGSQNVIETPYQVRKNHRRGLHWKDFMSRFEGPIVAGIDALFVTDWYSETDVLLEREAADARDTVHGPMDCQVVPSGPGFPGENNLRLFNSLLYAAKHKAIVVSPYFVPDDSMLYAITTAAQSGVEVQLFVSEIGDQFFVFHAQRSYYEALLRAGVRIFLYEKPTILHAKHMTIDDEVSVIGSSNMDMRSFTLDLEISVMVRDRDYTQRLRAVEDDYRAHSREITLDEWNARPLRRKVLDNFARLTAALQ
ncbi:cardiolipin synthase [Schumannella soli]|uniref:Cardiolipin synthase n=1 Tax=Schumannella soli TaxID=2590779 RepID=A0A506XWE6_9MICO|nr:cardiolipin synthase [Schumannella soli]TPW74135.1 cardiolipin synthase [Schumannella soli]